MKSKILQFIICLTIISPFLLLNSAEAMVWENYPTGNEYERLKHWYAENQGIGGRFTLQEDLILTGYLGLSSSLEAMITIETGDYSIIIEDNQILEINNVTIEGSGRDKPVIQVNQGSFEFNEGLILATQGRAVEVGSSGKINMPDNNCEKKIFAQGDNALGLFLEAEGVEFSFFDLQIKADAIGIRTQSILNLYRSNIDAESTSVISENKHPIYVYDTILKPKVEEFVFDQRGRIQTFLDAPFRYANQSLKSFDFPEEVKVEVCHPNGSEEYRSLQVNWNLEAFRDNLMIGEDFKITGSYDSDYVTMPEGTPVCKVFIRDSKPLKIEGSVSKRPFLMAFIEFENPIDAQSYVIESSFDKINWNPEEQVDKKDFRNYPDLITPLIFDDDLTRYFRIRVNGGIFDGVSNVLYLGINGPEEEKNNYGGDMDGSRGSGGLINVPRENASLEEGASETYNNNLNIETENSLKNNPETGSTKDAQNELSDLTSVIEDNATVLRTQETLEKEKTRWLFLSTLGGVFILTFVFLNRKNLLKMINRKKRGQ